MAMKKCKECGEDISSKAKSCPKCGVVLKSKGRFWLYVIGTVILLSIIGSITEENSATSSTKPESGLKLPSVGKQIVTYEKYNQIQNGMSYAEVVAIIGFAGEEVSRTKMEGVPGVMDSIDTVMYQWVNKNGSNMNVMFQNDQLNTKAQFGLQ